MSNRAKMVILSQYEKIAKLEADVIDLKQLLAQWQKNCTGRNGSPMPCGMLADHTIESPGGSPQ